MESEDSEPCPSRKRRVGIIDDNISESDSDFDVRPGRGRKKHFNVFDDSDSDSGSSIDLVPKRKKNRPAMITDSDSSSSGSDIVRRKQGVSKIDSDSDSSQSDWSLSSIKATSAPIKLQVLNDSSSESDGQSDKCPICLMALKDQKVGSPESCDHSFCIECIKEWSNNMNTCPVDRQPFNLILVRSHHNGKVIDLVPVKPRNQQNDDVLPVEDPTYCEICGNCDREDRMLLCDGCDLGFHLDCLTPRLTDVPVGLWYCSDCGRNDTATDLTIYLQEVEQHVPRPTGPPTRNATRLVPRTRQNERVRAQIMTNRTQTRNSRNEVQEQIQVVVSQNIGPSTSRKKKTKKSKKRGRKPRIKITYDIDEETGQRIVIQTKMRHKYKKKKKTRRARLAAPSKPVKSVKKRLAVQLGMVAPRISGSSIPEIRVNTTRNNIGNQRRQAGIPTLDLFGSRDDFFSGSDADNEGEGPSLMVHRRHNLSDRSTLRRAMNRKSLVMPPAPNPCDLLDSILDSQEKFHSRDAVLSLKNDGTIQIESKGKRAPGNNNSDRINLNHSYMGRVRKAPACSNATTAQNGSSSAVSNSDNYRTSVNNVTSDRVTTTNNSVSTSSAISSGSGNGDSEPIQDYSIRSNCDEDVEPKKSQGNSPRSESELDIYSDIETVSTSKVEESKGTSPVHDGPLNVQSDDEANNSDVSLVIDTEKLEEKPATVEEEHESKEEDVTSTTNVVPVCNTLEDEPEHKSCDEEDNDSEDGCPNFSMYSTESINLAKTTDLELLNQEANVGSSLDVVEKPVEVPETEEDHPPSPQEDEEPPRSPEPDLEPKEQNKTKDLTALYSDSDDEVFRVDREKPLGIAEPFGISDIRSLTEDISEEERSYTPCLDERVPFREGLEGLDTEAISDEEKNDFDEAQELKTASDGGDALEINAKECELDFTKPEEYEEGEIVDKLKKMEEAKKAESAEVKETPEPQKESPAKEAPTFKKISKSNKDRNYRDKEKQREKRSLSKENHSPRKKDRKKERRKEIERYNVRTVVAEKPRRMKDKFGRDARRRSGSRSSRSTSPQYRSLSRGRRSASNDKSRKRRARTHSGSRSRKRSRSRNRRRSTSRPRAKRRRSRERSKNRKKNRSLSRQRTRSHSPKRRRDWERRSRGWSPSPSRSRSPVTPSWTPPRLLESQPVKPHNLTVILTNDSNKKKRDKKRVEKKKKETVEKQKKRKRDKTPPPSKEVFASGDNILVSVSFNDEREREAIVKRKRDDDVTTRRTRKEKEKNRKEPRAKKKKTHDLSGVKPVAIIDLDRSPFKELTPSPKDVIVLSDSENGELRDDTVCDSSQQPDNYPTGPKTPPEPQVKFSLNPKPAQLRAISNPLHEPDDIDAEMDPQEELEQRLNDTLHKGPNTPPEPPNSPPSSPDAYDPFDPTKSRSPTPDNTSNVQSCIAQSTENSHNENLDTMDKSANQQSPDVSHTPPVVPDVQPADSQSNASTNTPDIAPKQTPERNISVVINQVVQSQASIFPVTLSKSQTQTTAYSTAPIVTSTPVSTNLTTSRINILNTTILTPAAIMAALPQRIVLPTITKSSPIKVSPTKPPIKSTPIKPMPNKSMTKASKQTARKSNSRNDGNDVMDLDSPYSPGPSDYEDLFEPPTESINKPQKTKQTNKKSNANKNQGSFDALFGSSPVHKTNKSNNKFEKKKATGMSKGTKLIGVKVDEDSLKILDDVPNSAVEMQVKDKFLKKLNRQERVVEEVKLVLKPHYNKKHINKEEYKDILRRSVPKICHNKSGEINPKKIQNLIEAYVKKIRHSKKVTSSSSVNPQK